MGMSNIQNRAHCIAPNQHRCSCNCVTHILKLPQRQLAPIEGFRPNVRCQKIDLKERVLMRQFRERKPVGLEGAAEFEEVSDCWEGCDAGQTVQECPVRELEQLLINFTKHVLAVENLGPPSEYDQHPEPLACVQLLSDTVSFACGPEVHRNSGTEPLPQVRKERRQDGVLCRSLGRNLT